MYKAEFLKFSRILVVLFLSINLSPCYWFLLLNLVKTTEKIQSWSKQSLILFKKELRKKSRKMYKDQLHVKTTTLYVTIHWSRLSNLGEINSTIKHFQMVSIYTILKKLGESWNLTASSTVIVEAGKCSMIEKGSRLPEHILFNFLPLYSLFTQLSLQYKST